MVPNASSPRAACDARFDMVQNPFHPWCLKNRRRSGVRFWREPYLGKPKAVVSWSQMSLGLAAIAKTIALLDRLAGCNDPQMTVTLSRWLVIPIPAMARTSIWVLLSSSVIVVRYYPVDVARLRSTQPGWGNIWVNSRCAIPMMRPLWSDRMARELVESALVVRPVCIFRTAQCFRCGQGAWSW